jgi:ribulose-phosphate 3-epimerase
MTHIIAPSILSANFLTLGKDIEMINSSDAAWLHVDVMDGVFVPNISFGMNIIKFMKSACTKPLDVHLMIVNPDKYITEFKNAGANILTVHYEACTHLHRTVNEIRAHDMTPGVAINPHTPISVLEDIITEVGLVCLMSVNPGFGGQSFIENTYAKIKQLKELCARKQTSVHIEIDGGVTLSNHKKLVASGANVLVAGSAVFKSSNPTETISALAKPIDKSISV